jgi:hypothetical protein
VGESTPAELLEELHARSAPEPDEEAAPALESLPPLDPLPGVDGTEFISNAAKPAPWLSGATISLAVHILLVLAMVAVGVVFHRPIGNAIVWLGLKIAGEEAPEIVPAPKSQNLPAIPEGGANNLPVAGGMAESSTPGKPAKEEEDASVESASPGKSTANTPGEAKPAEVPPVAENPAASAAAVKSQTPIAPIPLPTANKITTFAPPLAASVDGGQQEYLAAQDILRSKNGESVLQEAVRLLWVAVEKGNSSAEVALAELYRQGRGVAKNCDQTKILLTAAAKKGNGEAQKRLEQFLGEGCE